MPGLARQAPGRLARQQARHLHGQGRGPGDDAPLGGPLPSRPGQGEDIDAAMVVEAPVLAGQQDADEEGVHLRQGDRQAPAAIGDGKGPQQAAMTIQD